ncbi:Nucleoside phosphorylase domain protein [Metarhizium album ARSEF 1941]|uniref:Nucleoside phosphorylase domain protein n=1 Tax=Metarhizium album (strain ARSEF 1941) TaxID=1081103 RepID=A0A0B2WPW2_METAS|nr:Nucleoside phosphorylase domain protein [Metarhizium album ARSEF 1941]KHN95669.1 Nucleoside phosphorylase domain protein [Metarhizium album ARSEF 1941]
MATQPPPGTRRFEICIIHALPLEARMGKVHAAGTACGLASTFEHLKLALLMGICGASLRDTNGEDISLGDVVIGKHVVQYDLRRRYSHAFGMKDSPSEVLGRQNSEIRASVSKIESQKEAIRDSTHRYLAELLGKLDGRSGQLLEHSMPEDTRRTEAPAQTIGRPAIHFGTVASGDSVVKCSQVRDAIAEQSQAIAFEVEGAGVWVYVPCIVVRDVSDYADCRKDKQFQGYSAACASAYARAIVEQWVVTETRESRTASTTSERPVSFFNTASRTVNQGITQTFSGQINNF